VAGVGSDSPKAASVGGGRVDSGFMAFLLHVRGTLGKHEAAAVARRGPWGTK
jgi:hypothetical protein